MLRTRRAAVMLVGLSLALSACGSTDDAGSSDSTTNSSTDPVTITVFSIASEEAAVQRYKDVIADFETVNPTVRVEATFPGEQYEALLKTKMAANDLPDVFQTHGWTRDRYQPYLLGLSDAPWAKDIAPAMVANVTSDDGTVLALPISQRKAGINVNVKILSQYGIDVPTTWDEFLTAARTIRDKSGGSITPVHIGGADSWTIGAFYNWLAIPALISPTDNQASALLDGSFDWSKWDFVSKQLALLQSEQLINDDVLTAKYSDSAQLIAQSKVAFAFYGGGVISEVKRLNPDVDLQMMPIPSVEPGDAPTWSGGEGDTLAIWKDTKHAEAARAFVDFFAEPKNVKAIIGDAPDEPGLITATVDVGDVLTTDDPDIRVMPAFDRQYFPNGMWDVMCINGQELLSGSLTAAQVSAATKSEYERLRLAS